jgi:hypothetical protein
MEGLHVFGVLQLKYKYPFLCSFTCCVFVHVILMSISYICCYIYGFFPMITACMILLLFLYYEV